jgi:hypothetical protein
MRFVVSIILTPILSLRIRNKYEKITPANIVFNQFKGNEKSLFTAKYNDHDQKSKY